MSSPVQESLKTLSPENRAAFDKLDREQLYAIIFRMVKDIGRVDGLYFQGIENHCSLGLATRIDADCWAYMGKVQAKETMAILGLEQAATADALRQVLSCTDWYLSLEEKAWTLQTDGSLQLTVRQCRTQKIRVSKGLGMHACRQVREGFLTAFAQACNPRFKVECLGCPPERPAQGWCSWLFKLA